MQKWIERLHTLAIILFFVAAIWSIWTIYERTKLNQRYERLIEHREKLDALYEERINRFGSFLDRLQN